MKLNLTTWQRVMMVKILEGLRGNVATVRAAMGALDVLEMTDEEKISVGYKALPGGGGQWTDLEKTWEVELPEGSVEVVRRAVEGYEGWPVATGEQVVELVESLNFD